MNEFGDTIASKRRGMDLSLQQAADLLGTTKPHLWELEKGRTRNPTAFLLNSFRAEYKISAKRLLDLLDS